jgi:hypothetical protein
VILALLLLAVPATRLALYRWFPPRFDVSSIALTPEYQDPALLGRAWALPVAATFARRVDFQSNGSVCGPTSAANVFRSLGETPSTVKDVLRDSGECPFGVCWNGLSLEDLATVIAQKTRRNVTVLRDLSLERFRAELEHANDPARRYIVNFHRGLLFGKGGGHHSPVGGYLADRDLVFVLDVNPAFGPWLVSTERLFRAVDSVVPGTKKRRGLLLIQ